jgi:hypothetical protein
MQVERMDRKERQWATTFSHRCRKEFQFWKWGKTINKAFYMEPTILQNIE